MPGAHFFNSVVIAIKGALEVVRQSLKVIKKHPEISSYPFTALLFVSVTYPLIGDSIFARWYNRIFNDAGSIAPHHLRIILGLVGFSAFYTALVTAYFSCIVSAGVLAKLEGRPTPPLYGLRKVLRHFFRVTRFAILSVFFFPVGIYAQRGRLPKGWLGVLGSSITLHIAQVAPAILSTRKKFTATIRDAVDILGKTWKVGLTLKIAMYVVIFVVVALPKLIQHGLFKGHVASNVSWLVSLELAASSYVTLKVINSLFTTVLYYQAKTQGNN